MTLREIQRLASAVAGAQTHPLQKQIDEIVQQVRSGETNLSTVQWCLEQYQGCAEIYTQALAILQNGGQQDPTSADTNIREELLVNAFEEFLGI